MSVEEGFQRQDTLNGANQEELSEGKSGEAEKRLEEQKEDLNYIHNELKKLSVETNNENKRAPKLTKEERYTRQVEADASSIFIGNITYDVTPEIIEQHFEKCGEIKRITLLHDKHTGIPKGYAYVQFESSEVQEKALKLNGTELNGNNINVYKKRTNVPGYHKYSQYQSPFCYPTQWSYNYNAFSDLPGMNFFPPYASQSHHKHFDHRRTPSNNYRGWRTGHGSRNFYRHDIRLRENSQRQEAADHHQHILENDQKSSSNKKLSFTEQRNESITPPNS